jgi:sugar (pentulose or hexulose) kinase
VPSAAEEAVVTYLIAIDNGSQSTKVSVIDERGQVHASARRRLRPYDTSVPGRVVHPGDDLWDSIRATCQEAMSRFAGRPEEIAGVGLCTIRFCRVLLDEAGELTEPVLSWMDPRVSAPHVRTDPRTRWVTTSSGYITHRLTGRFVDASANYQGVWPIDQVTASWSSDPVAYVVTGMPREMLMDLAAPGDLLGHLTREAADATGVPAGLPVFATANDKAVEALGSGLRSADTVLLSLGTYIASMTAGSAAAAAQGAYWSNFASTPGDYLYESGGIRRGMWTVSWYRSLIDGDHREEPVPVDSLTEDQLNAGAAAVPAGSNGLMTVLDWLAPGEAPHRRGAILGFDGTQGRYHVYRSILEGIALTMVNHTRTMEQALGRQFSAVVVAGGGSQSDLMMQIVADVFDLPACRTSMRDAAGLGAAICAAVGSGVHRDFDTAVDAMVTVADVFDPVSGQVAAYRRINDVYSKLSTYTDPLFRWTTGNIGHLVAV